MRFDGYIQAMVLFPTKHAVLEHDKASNIEDHTAFGESDIDSVYFYIGIELLQRYEGWETYISSVRNKSNGLLNSAGCAIKEGDVRKVEG